MATIGLDQLFYAKITEDEDGNETYDKPLRLAKAISADLSVELAEATLFDDDGTEIPIKEFKSGKLSLGIKDLPPKAVADLAGATIDYNGVIVSASEDGGDPVAIGFRTKKADGKYRYYWLYRVVFTTPSDNLATKGDSIAFQTPKIEGTVSRRKRIDGNGKHPWKTEANEGDAKISADTLSKWFSAVYEPVFMDEPNTPPEIPELPPVDIGYVRYFYSIIDDGVQIENIKTDSASLTVADYLSRGGEVQYLSGKYYEDIQIGQETVKNGIPVINLASGAFGSAVSLTSVALPGTLKAVESEAFNWLINLTKITVNANNMTFASNGVCLYSKDMTTLFRVPIKANVTEFMDYNITSIKAYAFARTNVVRVMSSKRITVEKNAFADCSLFEAVYYYSLVSGGIMILGIDTTESKITDLIIPPKIENIAVERIDAGAFYSATSLVSITLPLKTAVIADTAFNNLTNLKSIKIDSANQTYASDEVSLYTKNMQTLIRVPINAAIGSGYTFANTVTKIGAYAFYNSKLEVVTIPARITSIGNFGFANSLNLRTVTFENKNTTLGSNVFLNCPIS